MTPNFEEILLELSYRVPTGIVDLTNEQQLNELASILEERGIYNSKAINALREKAKTNQKDPDVTYVDKKGQKRTVKYTSAIKYDEKHPAYLAAMKLMNKKSKAPKEQPKVKPNAVKVSDAEKRIQQKSKVSAPTKDVAPTKPSKQGGNLDTLLKGFEDNKNNATSKANVAQAIKSISSQLTTFAKAKGNPHAADHKKVAELTNKLFSGGKLSASEQKLVASYVRVAEPTDKNPNAAKFYIAREPNNFTSQGPKKRERIYVGSKDKSTPVIGAFRQWAETNGIPMLATSTFGGKKTTANQAYLDSNGNTRLLTNASKVQKDKTGSVLGVKIGQLNIVRSNPDEPGISKNESKKRAKNNRIMEEYAQKIEEGDMDFIDMDNGVVPDNPKNRVIVIQGAIEGMATNLTKLANKAMVGEPNTLGLIKELSNYGKLDPNKNPEQWLGGFENLLSRIANHEGEPSLKEAWANYAEIFVAIREMHDNGKGTENGKCALLPQSTTLETVDVITISNGKGDNRIVTLDGRSVKKGVGGASALTAKTRKSTYKDDPKGLIKKGVTEVSESHNVPYQLSIDKPLKEHKKLNDTYQQFLKEKAIKLRVDPKFVSQLEKDAKTKGGRGYSKIESAYQNIKLERGKAGLPTDDEVMSKVRMRLTSYYMYGEIAHEVYNANVDVQDFANDSVLSQKEDRGGAALARQGKIAIDRSDGIEILAYPKAEFNIGFTLEGKSKNPGAGRFHNEKKRI